MCTAPICRAAHSYMPCSTCAARHIRCTAYIFKTCAARHILKAYPLLPRHMSLLLNAYRVLSFDTRTAYVISARHKRSFLHDSCSRAFTYAVQHNLMPCSTATYAVAKCAARHMWCRATSTVKSHHDIVYIKLFISI